MNRESEEIADIICMGLPEEFHEEDAQVSLMVYAAAVEYVYKQYEDRPVLRRPKVRFHRIDSLITADMDEALEFRPGHDCEECREGVQKTLVWLKQHPDRLIALANIHYTEVFSR